jgi:hypothetical protein
MGVAMPERRSFEVGTPQQFGWVEGLVKALLVLNLLDAVFTLFWINLGLAKEANALMRALVHDHPFAFVAVKLALVGLGSYLLWARRRNPSAVIAIFAMFFVYYLVLLHHLRYSSLFLSAYLWRCGFQIVC